MKDCSLLVLQNSVIRLRCEEVKGKLFDQIYFIHCQRCYILMQLLGCSDAYSDSTTYDAVMIPTVMLVLPIVGNGI